MKTKETEMTKEAALALLVKERQVSIKACQAEIEATLEKYNCKIDVTVVLKSNSITPSIQIISKG